MNSNPMRCLSLLGCANTLFVVMAWASSSPGVAQITPDPTLPTNSVVTQNGDTFTINGGTAAGSNLFHSFSAFSLPSGTALFDNATNITNIISRVTGGSISNINGTIRANGNANLFLINPNGIIFGSNAKLDIGGSFVASTADSIQFADDRFFSAADPSASTSPLLMVSVPLGVQYGSNPGSIQVQGSTLEVKPGQSLALVGGNVSMDGGKLGASGGRIEIGSIAAGGNIGLSVNGSEVRLSFADGVPRNDVSLTNGAQVSVQAGGGGSIAINARSITISGGNTRVRAGIDKGLGSVGSQAGDIDINATERINIIDNGVVDNNPIVSNQVLQGGTGNSGNINITTGSLFLTDAAALVTSTSGTGNAGDVKITAKDTISLDATSGIASNVESGGVGNGGSIEIEITTGSLSVTNASQLQTLVRDTSPDGTGPGGRGDAGKVRITAKDTVLDGTRTSPDGKVFASVIGSVVLSGAVGKGGRIEITTGSLSLTNGAALSTSNEGIGEAGSIEVKATDSIRLENRATISSNTTGGGGNINLESPLIVLRGSGLPEDTVISTNADGSNSDAGNINIKTTFLVGVPKENSDITANSTQARGGQVFIDVSAGGIYGLQFRQQLTPRSDITAKGRDPSLTGTVSIYTSGIDPEKGLAELPVTLNDPSNEIVSTCQAAAEGNTFTITGRGGLPEDPTGIIRGQTVWRDLQDFSQGTEGEQASSPNPQALMSKPSSRLVEANSWVRDEQGNVVLVAVEGNGTSSTYKSRQPDCQE